MSEPNQVSRKWRFYLTDMIGFASNALSYTAGLSKAEFVADTRTYDATLRNLELIGEAARNIPEEVRSAHPEIPWRMIIATRNRLIHAYLGIDDDTIWSIIQDDVPELLRALAAMRRDEEAGGQR